MIDENALIYPVPESLCASCKHCELATSHNTYESQLRFAKCTSPNVSDINNYADCNYRYRCKGNDYESSFERFPLMPTNVVVIEPTQSLPNVWDIARFFAWPAWIGVMVMCLIRVFYG